MKTTTSMNQWIPLAALGLTLAGMDARAVQNYYFGPGATHYVTALGGDQTDTQIYQVEGAWGSSTTTVTYDDTMSPDPTNIPGSIKWIYDDQDQGPASDANDITLISMTQGFQPGWFGDLGQPQNDYNLASWGAFSFDLNINLTTSSNVDFPPLFYGQNWDKLYPGNGQNVNPNAQAQGFNVVPPITTPGWHHIRIPFTGANTDPSAATFGTYFWCPGGSGNQHLEFNIANLQLEKGTLAVPPTLSVQPLPYQGLLLDYETSTVNASAGIYNRESIYTVGTHPWIGNGQPVTYSMTVLSAAQGMQLNMFVSPSTLYANPENNGSNVCWLKIEGQANGSALASVHWKTNSPLSFTMLYAPPPAGGLLGDALPYPSLTGTWSFTFNSDTSFTLTGPGGATHAFTVPQSWIDDWVGDTSSTTPGDAYIYYGAEANSSAAQGQVWLSSVSTAGDSDPVTNNFTQALDTTTWGVDDNGDSTLVDTNSYMFTWTLPALFYDLVGTTNLVSPISWSDVLSNNLMAHVYRPGVTERAVVPSANFPPGPDQYFALVRLAAYNLVVLLPGETFAPGTATGKTGTPLPQQVGVPFNVTVNALSPNNTLQADCVDTLNILTGDTAASFSTPETLTAGTVTFSFTFGTAGTWYVRATDTLDNSVDVLSSTVTVSP
jgi:hypothetical protein